MKKVQQVAATEVEKDSVKEAELAGMGHSAARREWNRWSLSKRRAYRRELAKK